jgi:hypothetical protein
VGLLHFANGYAAALTGCCCFRYIRHTQMFLVHCWHYHCQHDMLQHLRHQHCCAAAQHSCTLQRRFSTALQCNDVPACTHSDIMQVYKEDAPALQAAQLLSACCCVAGRNMLQHSSNDGSALTYLNYFQDGPTGPNSILRAT